MARRKPSDSAFPAGVVLVDKPSGITSHGVVSKLRKLFDTRRIGHGGTLDPAATGVLVLFTGRATRLAPYLGGGAKMYLTTIRLGEATTTDDAEGDVCATGSVPNLTHAEISASAEGFLGDIDQIPPAISAVHHDGERAYRIARRGDSVELKPRRVHIDAIDALEWSPPDVVARVTCGTGTYIRSLARDWGEHLGTHAHVRTLRRERSGVFRIEDAITLDEIAERVQRGAPLDEIVTDPGAALVEALGGYRELNPDDTKRFVCGNDFPDDSGELGTVAVLDPSGRLLGVGERRSDGSLAPVVVLTAP